MTETNREQGPHTKADHDLVLGLDFGSDAARCALIDTTNGEERAISSMQYPRWQKGLYCDPAQSSFRQHPLDYLEAMEMTVADVLQQVPAARDHVKAIGIAMTGSTPVAVDQAGIPLALKPAFAEYPNAMFIMWKDHSGHKENELINRFSRSRESDYTRSRLCGNYSVEHFWTKALHVFLDPKIRAEAHSFVEASDWLPGVLTGSSQPETLKRGMGIAASRALWNRAWGGYPPDTFFAQLDPVLAGLIGTFDPQAYTCDQPAGNLSEKWAKRFGLRQDVVVSVGNLDCHAGAIGAGVHDRAMVEIIGTSTVAITVAPFNQEGATVPGVPQQALSMILPGEMGYEGGQSAFGDLYNWFKQVLTWPAHHILAETTLVDATTRAQLVAEMESKLMPELTRQAEGLSAASQGLVATDWINGRRSPNADFGLTGTIAGLTLSSTAPGIYKSLVEATAFGAKCFIDQFQQGGGHIEEVIAVGGISRKSPFVMQVLSDVIGIPIKVLATQEACSLGVAMCAAVAAGLYPSMQDAQHAMKGEISTVYAPKKENAERYCADYARYLELEKVKAIIS